MTWTEWVDMAVARHAQLAAAGERVSVLSFAPSYATLHRWRRLKSAPQTEAAVQRWAGALGLDAGQAVEAWRGRRDW